jgi:hypothetical protein
MMQYPLGKLVANYYDIAGRRWYGDSDFAHGAPPLSLEKRELP